MPACTRWPRVSGSWSGWPPPWPRLELRSRSRRGTTRLGPRWPRGCAGRFPPASGPHAGRP
eukprot:11037888-Alexandrium_andersonii.AAC.1